MKKNERIAELEKAKEANDSILGELVEDHNRLVGEMNMMQDGVRALIDELHVANERTLYLSKLVEGPDHAKGPVITVLSAHGRLEKIKKAIAPA